MSRVCVCVCDCWKREGKPMARTRTRRNQRRDNDCGRLVTITDTLFHVYVKVHGVNY